MLATLDASEVLPTEWVTSTRAVVTLPQKRSTAKPSGPVAELIEAPIVYPNAESHPTATAIAWQMWRIRNSERRPTGSTIAPTLTLSTESRLTAVVLRTGSSPGSKSTSLSRSRIVVVHGATMTRFSRRIASARESTTTGRRAISGSSHHHSSPRWGSSLTKPWLRDGKNRGRPTRQVHSAVGGRTPRSFDRPHRSDAWPRRQRGLRREASSHEHLETPNEQLRAALRRPWC